MKDDFGALKRFATPSVPPLVSVQSKKILLATFGFGDASGKGFGSAFDTKRGLSFRIGAWGDDESDESSNWREATNCVEALEEEAEKGEFSDTEVFLCTDNQVFEQGYKRGTSSSRKLLDLIIRVRALSMKYNIRLRVVHVSGKRMIASGVDGLSRGALNEGVMTGERDFLSFFPLNLAATTKAPKLMDWIKSWAGLDAQLLSPEEWFEKGHDIGGWSEPKPWQQFKMPTIQAGKYVWAPPPGAADVALEELRKARHKRQASTHIFVCQRVFTTQWFKQLHKAADIVLTVPACTSFWPASHFEPLVIGICFPFIREQPWQLRGTPKMLSMERQLSGLWKGDDLDARDILRKFCHTCWGLRAVPRSVVSGALYFARQQSVPRGSSTCRKEGHRPGKDCGSKMEDDDKERPIQGLPPGETG